MKYRHIKLSTARSYATVEEIEEDPRKMPHLGPYPTDGHVYVPEKQDLNEAFSELKRLMMDRKLNEMRRLIEEYGNLSAVQLPPEHSGPQPARKKRAARP